MVRLSTQSMRPFALCAPNEACHSSSQGPVWHTTLLVKPGRRRVNQDHGISISNRDQYIGADHAHQTDAGQAYMAERVYAAYRAIS